MSIDNLVQDCRATGRLAEEAERWLGDEANAATVGRERADLVRYVRKAAHRAERLARAAGRPMCAGVFGPSQAGKSYLVEVLARPEDGALRARFPGHDPVDFLAEINPIGEKEATGLDALHRRDGRRDPTRRAGAPACPERDRSCEDPRQHLPA